MEKKFRVWDKIRKQMVVLDYLWLCSEYNSLCFSTEKWMHKYDYKPIENWPLEMDENPDHFEIMQYIGVKDKNGVEIYERDIVNGGCYNGSYAYGKIEFYKGSFISIPIGKFLEGTDDRFYNMEVIGNIYENQDKNDVQ